MPVSLDHLLLLECDRLRYHIARVEYHGRYGRTHDLYGCLDYLALDGQSGVLGIQLTSSSNVSARRKKIIANLPRQWLEAGNRAEIWSYGERGRRGKQKVLTLRRVSITLADLLPPEEDTHETIGSHPGSSEPV